MDFYIRSLVRRYQVDPTDENAHQLARAVCRTADNPKLRKILISGGFGAGWTTWTSDEIARTIMLDYPPLVEALEAGEEVTDEHPAIQSMLEAIEEAGGHAPYLGGLEGLYVAKVEGPFRITEYDGAERVETFEDLYFED